VLLVGSCGFWLGCSVYPNLCRQPVPATCAGLGPQSEEGDVFIGQLTLCADPQ
jgi:hypothetical protein